VISSVAWKVVSAKFVTLAHKIQTRLDQLSWNGDFYTHWIAENPDYRPDVGVDMSKQVALSNAYSLTRYLPHEKCAAIIKTYQRIRAEMPSTSPSEFYGIYPPFERDVTQNSPGLVWEYVNGGVLTMVAAELAQGAFEHGFEEYAGDFLLRQKKIADRYRGYLPAVLRGKRFDALQASFRKLQLTELANADFGPGIPRVSVWTEPDKDFRDLSAGPQEFAGIPFDIIDPQRNGHRSCVILSSLANYAKSATIPVHAKAASFYLLHTSSEAEPTVGTLTIRYADCTSHSRYIQQGKNIGSWWEPRDSKYNREGPRISDILRLAWHRSAHGLPDLGIFAADFDNPHPNREIASLELAAGAGNSKWMVLAATLSDQPVFFPPYDDLSSGIPDAWNAAIDWTILEGRNALGFSP
jgi:hypothetical protein